MAEKETGARAKLQRVKASAQIMPLSKFLKSLDRKRQLSRRDRLRIVEQAILLLEMNYVHLPLKRAIHAIDPIQRLKLLKFSLETKEQALESGLQFHKRMLEIFVSLRDLHTIYMLPAPFRNQVAFLPFLVEQYFVAGSKGQMIEKFMVSRVVKKFIKRTRWAGAAVANFESGVEVICWNGVPIRRAIEMNGETQPGSNLEARFARGLDNLTIRPLDLSIPPDENWVSITYRSMKGKVLTLAQEWRAAALATKTNRKRLCAVDIRKTKVNQLRAMLLKKRYGDRVLPVRKEFQNIFYAKIGTVNKRTFGYIRLFSFEVDADKFVSEFKSVITAKEFPQEGLVIDVRGNGGGQIRAGERLLQLFTPRRIKPELFEFINTPVNLEICREAPKQWDLSRWGRSIAEAVVTGATYSDGFPINSEESCNDIGQVYYGPVIVITDALSYSTTDMFVAGFQDNAVGEVLGISGNTGAGGANNWHHVSELEPHFSEYKPLPQNADFSVAMRRSIRVGRLAGRPLEEFGIAPDQRHYMTKDDLLKGNNDLIRRAARILAEKPSYSISVRRRRRKDGSGSVVVSARSKIRSGKKKDNISQLDICLGGRPCEHVAAENGSIAPITFTFGKTKRTELEVQAFDGAKQMVAAYRRK